MSLHKDETYDLAIHLGDPAAFSFGLVVVNEICRKPTAPRKKMN